MASLLIGILPPTTVKKNIERLRKENEQNNLSKYALHEPHITIYLNSFNNKRKVISILKKIIKKYSPINIQLDKITTFHKDPATGNIVYIYKLKKDKKLKNMRNEIIKELKSLQTPEYKKFLLQLNPNYTKQEKSTIQKYGTTIAPDKFIFHCTIFSTKNKLKLEKSPGISYSIKHLHLLKLKNGKYSVYKRI